MVWNLWFTDFMASHVQGCHSHLHARAEGRSRRGAGHTALAYGAYFEMTVTALVVTVALRTGLTRMRNKSVPLMVLVGEDDRLLETDPELKEVLDKMKEEIASQRAEIDALRQRLTDSS